jgi:hypothetical protein
MALGSTQPLTEMSTRNLPEDKGRPTRKADNLTSICEPIVYRKFGSLYVSQSYGPPRPVTGIALHFLSEKNKRFWEELIAYFPWYDTDRIENDASSSSSIVAIVLVAAVMFLPSRCLATIEDTHTDTKPMRGLYEVRLWDGLRFREIHTKFHKILVPAFKS